MIYLSQEMDQKILQKTEEKKSAMNLVHPVECKELSAIMQIISANICATDIAELTTISSRSHQMPTKKYEACIGVVRKACVLNRPL